MFPLISPSFGTLRVGEDHPPGHLTNYKKKKKKKKNPSTGSKDIASERSYEDADADADADADGIRTKPICGGHNKSVNTRKTGPIRENSANTKMTSFNVLFRKKMAAMFSSALPLINCSCICIICLNCSCIYRNRHNVQQLSLVQKINGILTTILVYFVSRSSHSCKET